MLQLLDIVEAAPSRHTRVTSMTEADAATLLPPLAALNAVAAQAAAAQVDDSLLAELRQANEQLLAAAHAGDALAARNGDEAFHAALVDRAGNRFLTLALAPLSLHWRRYNGLYFTHATPSEESFREHERIVEAVANGDAALAGELTQRNILRPIRGARAA